MDLSIPCYTKQNTPQEPAKKKPVFIRDVARALTRRLEEAQTSIHWASVWKECSLQNVPALTWPENDPMLNLLVQQGWSEGMIVYVMAQDSRYEPEKQKPLLQIKMLCSRSQLLTELPVIYDFIDHLDLDAFRSL